MSTNGLKLFDFKRVFLSLIGIIFLSILFGFPLLHLVTIGFQSDQLNFKNVVVYIVEPAFLKALYFTLLQGVLTALLSIFLGFILALYINELKKMHSLCESFLESIFAVPTIVTGFAIILLFGRSGWLGKMSEMHSIYGLTGIIFANLFYSVPFSTVCFLQNFRTMPPSILKLKALLNLGDFIFFKKVLLPYFSQVTALIFFQILLINSQNFTLALILGGGPLSSTLETLIYQNIFFTFDMSKAMAYSFFQTTLFGFLGYFVFLSIPQGVVLPKSTPKQILNKRLPAILPVGILIFLGLVVICIFADGLTNFYDQINIYDFKELRQALKYSVIFAIAASICSQLAVYCASFCVIWLNICGTKKIAHILMASIFVLATASPVVTSFSILLWFQGKDPIWKLCAIPAVQSVGLFAFLLPLQYAEIKQIIMQNYKLNSLLNLTWYRQLTSVYLPASKGLIFRGILLGILIVIGQFTVTAILARPQVETITGLIYRQMAQYQHESAAFTSMLFLSFIFCVLFAVNFFRGHSQKHV